MLGLVNWLFLCVSCKWFHESLCVCVCVCILYWFFVCFVILLVYKIHLDCVGMRSLNIMLILSRSTQFSNLWCSWNKVLTIRFKLFEFERKIIILRPSSLDWTIFLLKRFADGGIYEIGMKGMLNVWCYYALFQKPIMW